MALDLQGGVEMTKRRRCEKQCEWVNRWVIGGGLQSCMDHCQLFYPNVLERIAIALGVEPKMLLRQRQAK